MINKSSNLKLPFLEIRGYWQVNLAMNTTEPYADTNLDSQKLGTLFERAAITILKELFLCWGYENIESHQQKSGTQHGFDIFLRCPGTTSLFIFSLNARHLKNIMRLMSMN